MSGENDGTGAEIGLKTQRKSLHVSHQMHNHCMKKISCNISLERGKVQLQNDTNCNFQSQF